MDYKRLWCSTHFNRRYPKKKYVGNLFLTFCCLFIFIFGIPFATTKVINYSFPQDDVLAEYIKDSVIRLRINKLKIKKQELKLKITESQNLDEKFNYLSSMREIDEQILKLERSSNDTNR